MTKAADPNEFLDFSTTDGPSVPGRLYVPPEAATSARPVIVFLHGAGEAGTNNFSQVGGNIDNLFAEAKRRGAFLYAPQAITNSPQGRFGWNSTVRTDLVLSKLDQILAEQNTDPNLVYITGLSMGGGGTWNMSSRYPNRFAAALPIAGVLTDTDYVPANQLEIPTWAFHARNDGVVTVRRSQGVVNDILTAAGESTLTFPGRASAEVFEYVNDDLGLRYTEFPTGGHGIWPAVYNTPEVYDWMFSHTLAVPEPSSMGLLLIGAVYSTFVGRRSRLR